MAQFSEDVANAIRDFLTVGNWSFSFDEQKGCFKFGMSGKGKIKNFTYIIVVQESDYTVYAVAPIGCDSGNAKMLSAMAEYICRANYGLRQGNFELDMRDGEIRCKSFVDCEGITPTSEMIRNSIHVPALMYLRYGDGIVDIIFGNATAEEAIRKCE